MKKFLLFSLILISCTTFAQSPTTFKQLDLIKARGYNPPNAWAGSSLTYPLVGQDFDLTFAVDASFIIDFTEFKLGRPWSVLFYGNFGLPNYNRINAFNSTVSAQDGISVGLQAYTTFGNLADKAFTIYLNAVEKLNTFDTATVNSYRFGSGFELSVRGGGLPLILNVSPNYILLDDKAEFAGVQNETTSKGLWTVDTFVIVPVGRSLGLLVQPTFAEEASPQVKVGLITAVDL